MKPSLPLALVAFISTLLPGYLASGHEKRNYNDYDYFALEHDPSDASLSRVLASLGLELVEQAGSLENTWLVRRQKEGNLQSKRIVNDLVNLRRRNRGGLVGRDGDGAIFQAVKHFSQQIPRQRIKRDDSKLILRAPPPLPTGNETSASVAEHMNITDPVFHDQWYLVNDEFPTHMVNAAPVWESGNAGEGVIAAMVDDGLDFESDDLADNFDAVNSYDFNLHVPLPKPVLFDDHHGTRCAGQIAAVKNDVCGIGIAHKAKVAGIRILSGPISDVDEAAALNYGYDNTSIYSCSWGPPDDGRSMEGPSYIVQKAVVNGILNGRGGKGSVFVFASGNGAAQDDQCNFDGYTNSIYSVTVSAVDYQGLHPYYSEPCAANMVVTYSSGSGKFIVTTDVGKDKCSRSHGGTSAAAPNAVGIFTLALSARPELTWRDIQHIAVRTAKMINADDPDWENTAAGRRFSYKYGYGSLDAFAYVEAAKDWTLVKPQAWLHTTPVQLNNGQMTFSEDGQSVEMTGGEPIGQGGVKSSMRITRGMLIEDNFDKLEHITIKVWISHSRRGDVEVELVSPNGIKSVLAAKRRFDQDSDGFPGWTFMTVKHWDEDPVGEWTLRVSDQQKEGESGSFLGWTMTFWGSVIDAGKAKTFVLSDPNTPFPPPPEADDVPAPATSSIATSKAYPKPTAHLPGDHGTAEGEADKPAFPGGQEDAAEPTQADGAPSQSISSTPDEGWFPGINKLVSNSKWVFGAIGIVVVFGLSAGAYLLWRRRAAARRRRGDYTSVAGDDVALGSMRGAGGLSTAAAGRGGGGTKELYDAFGEVSDDDEFLDEEAGMRRPLTESYHEGFLDDADSPSPNRASESHYRDHDDQQRHDATSPEGGSVDDGSWEHASTDLT
ncbi:hypothetical protein SCHPADRAFT_899101 [Schizopora paradoxa]|uniref:P/Homo B domain-containing protein n=1 Tax=Schizopora paradoxa TaxID=27342 RepID=A0A0H2S5M4_9AGAM|nr:hypothetical protein SCHPADRAFT_899101 [Schizopora paradoxa]